jgi:Zn-dependent M28 family amino/carboxypeptidase
VLFAAWGAQELGEMGSRYYLAHPLYPLEDVTAVLQLDAVAGGAAYQLDARGSREKDGQWLFSMEQAKNLLGGRLQFSFPEDKGVPPFSPDALFNRDTIRISSDHDPFRDLGFQTLRIAWREADETNLDDSQADTIDPKRLASAGKITMLAIMMNTR